ncbi:glycosyltransferase family 8 protein [Aaosphaeria arxii CBS 175.79]|uniref:glycogenin glucosyltransferase n=1 Tax=Aaosphaeria arxii CBS 175.79 TaxID=1450172 RepID=A0A6A5Y754_9PLEO|nr:glycosyltransferase family 8 protein [Aaosphaeria arxii CBS 175.79]KAF2020384.1 glycosyltransferase family 8 protein [Aaosphaeria arxii CBS 175.79]
MAQPLEDVYCTLLMSDSYLPGAAVLANSLRDAGTTKKLAVLITLETLSAETITKLKSLYDYLIPVPHISNPNPSNLYLMGRPDLSFAFTKIALWRQVQFRKIVYMDADVVALRALDELFNLDVPFAAAPDVGWPDAFNSGVMLLTPNMGDYWALQTLAATGDSFDGADQGLLNQYYENRNWHRLSFTYNTTPNAQYQWEPAYRYYKSNISAVHFIGKDKPWSRPSGSGGPGVYNELLARWWAVHDRHKSDAYGPQPRLSGPTATAAGVSHGEGEATSTSSNTSSTHNANVPEIIVHPDAPPTSTEAPLTEPGDLAENIDQGIVEPTPTVELRKFSAPQMEWDATRFEPPTESKPEAANFPSEVYEFNESRELFQAPHAYPEPPKDMWYEVPQTKPTPSEKPRPIFPWEQQPDRPKATRIFAEDLPPEPTPAAQPIAPIPTHPFSTVHYDENNANTNNGQGEASGLSSPERVTSPKTADESWQEFQQTSVNAWDNVPSIANYVRAIMDAQTRKTKTFNEPHSPGTEILSPSAVRPGRRESLIITDFPSAVDRPSLPVTPAPIRRPTFWGEERDEAGELPVAEGVPDQADWVCPQCGFSSLSESDFKSAPRQSSPVFTSSAIVPPAFTTTITTAAETTPGTSLPKAKPSKTPIDPLTASFARYKEGISRRGAPLASLTDPSLLSHPTHITDLQA